MKRLLSIALVLLYTSLNLGLVVNMHYCSGHIASVSLSSSSAGCGSCGKTSPAKKCCEDTQTQLSAGSDQINPKLSPALPDFSPFIAFLPSYFYVVYAPEQIALTTYIQPSGISETGPPKTPIYIQIRSLII